MDKYPVLAGEQAAGELTVTPEALYTVFDISCPQREGLWCAWAVGESGRLRIGVLEPEAGYLHIRRRFSRQLTEGLTAEELETCFRCLAVFGENMTRLTDRRSSRKEK